MAQCKEPTSGPDGPFIALSTQTIAVTGPEAGASPAPVVISLSNEGPGDLTGLATAVTYGLGEPFGWLAAELSDTAAPSVLTLSFAIEGFPSGQYTATD